ncbi:DUF5597 domain-containing protein [Microbulbifer litoralis]|uniref:GH35 family beta-galactosidase n=1 Tax=Microbulbifer litoralis TaxID=2933965 RepID=UPI002027EDEE|nr:DUF5597 domain-containing protein [Microbulbifer sp. GX H0434]
MKKILRNFLAGSALALLALPAAAIPHLHKDGDNIQLLVDGSPFTMRGGELGNSSSSSLDYMEVVWPKAEEMHLNTLLVPVYWELIEPQEGEFDFSLVQGLIERARREEQKLVFLWFGSWKNSMSTYVPSWVKRDSERFPRARSADGQPQEILSPFGPENVAADSRAFAALLRFIEKVDARRNTVLMVQVENEIGMLPSARDHHPLADRAFESEVPEVLLGYLDERRDKLEPELLDAWRSSDFSTSGSWAEVFGQGPAAEEIFTAWHFARYANAVAAAGKAEYPLPMYVNAALNRPGVKPGDYPSGGPLPHLMDVWKAAAPAVDLLVPDFYNPRFQHWNDRYTRQGDPLFIPEIRFTPDVGAKAMFAFGRYNTLGFSPFSIETGRDEARQSLRHSYELIAQLDEIIADGSIASEGVWLTKDKPQMTFQLGDYRFTARHELTLGWSPGADADQWPHAGAMVLQTGPEDFIVAGTGVVLTFASGEASEGASEGARAGIDVLYEGEFEDGEWQPGRRLNGDQSHQGRHLRIPDGEWQIQKLKLYRY